MEMVKIGKSKKRWMRQWHRAEQLPCLPSTCQACPWSVDLREGPSLVSDWLARS